MDQLKKTCLHDKHIALGAVMSPFGGFDMPIQYAGITEEHNAVRNHCGVFDVSHMGEMNISGPDAERFVNHIFTNNISDAPDKQIFYGMMCRPNGGTVDDLLVYKRGENNFLLVINASNINKDAEWIQENASGYDITIDDLSDSLGELAVQGPEAETVMRQVLGIECEKMRFYTFDEISLDGEYILVSRTGYTGEDGFEIYAAHNVIRRMWDSLMESGKCSPCGLGCRDTLRFEVGLPLYGDELSEEITPIMAGLGMFVKFDKQEFIGREALMKEKAGGPAKKLVGLELLDRAIPRHGYEVIDENGNQAGTITTGYRGISVDKSIAIALVDAKYALRDTKLYVKIRRKVFPAVVVPKKFYRKNYKK